MTHVYTDGGRRKAGYKGTAGDCGARAMAIALQLPYKTAYMMLAKAEKSIGRPKSARNGMCCDTMNNVLIGRGWRYCPIPKTPGQKATSRSMPPGRIIALMDRHYCAIINKVTHDTWNSSEKEIHGFWRKI